MDTSARWINDYLDPPATPEEQAELLTLAGFPLEASEPVDGDVRQDFEMTSNRGDCVCHLGLAREIAALSGRRLVPPAADLQPAGDRDAGSVVTVTNEDTRGCPLYTARVIEGVTVGPSPDWLADRLRARGDIPRNNVVDATNFVLFELGQPTHVFDLARLAGPEIRIRRAQPGEPFLPLGEGAREIRLVADDLVIAGAERAVALGGVKGGAGSMVTEDTTDVVLEAATFDPVTVRATSRRHGIGSDSAYRFERGVHPGQVNAAAERLAALILEVAGGRLLPGVVSAGAPVPERRVVTMRPQRARMILGLPIEDGEMIAGLDRLGFEPVGEDDVIRCRIPVHRLDIEREIDLIEEVARVHRLERIPVRETVAVRVAPETPRARARRAVSRALVGMGFLECITHSLVADDAAAAFMPADLRPLRLQDERAKAEPVLRPSVIPSLLRVYAHNRDNGHPEVRLFESAACFARNDRGHLETTNLALLVPADDHETALRTIRGVIDRLVTIVRGPEAVVDVAALGAGDPSGPAVPWLEPAAVVRFEGAVLGTFGLTAPAVTDHAGLDAPVAVAELGLPALYDQAPPATEIHPMPTVPAIARDVSAVVGETTAWGELEAAARSLHLEHLESIRYVTTFRGTQLGAGRKSITMRLVFRAPDATLTHDDVDPQMDRLVTALVDRCGAEIRG